MERRMLTRFDSKVSIPPEVMVREVGGESVVLDLKTEKYLGLDDVATSMWQALTTAESVEAAYKVLAANFDVEGEQLRHDLDDFVQELIKLGLIDVGDKG
jgi:hypothetical protein